MSESRDDPKNDSLETLAETSGTALGLIADAVALAGAATIGGFAAASGGLIGTGMLFVAQKMADRRLNKVLADLNKELLALKADKEITDEMLVAIYEILDHARFTLSDEKLRALKNAAVHSVISDADRITRHRLNRAAIDLVPEHVQVLKDIFEVTHGRPHHPGRAISGNPFELNPNGLKLTPPHVKLGMNEEIYTSLLFDLQRQGMIVDENEGTFDGVGSNLKDPRTTRFGDQFLDWITDLSDPPNKPTDG